MSGPNDITELPVAVEVPGQCQQLYESNVVLLGFDVVQYHFIPSYNDGGVAVRGIPQLAYNFNGYQFWFSTAENRDLFIADPWKYAPAWGGFCSWGVALELPPKWPWQPDYLGPPASPWNGWLVVNGTLMFNIWASYSDRFMQNSEENIRLAIERWKGWFGELHAGPFNTHCIGHGPLQNWCLAQQPSPWLQSLPECEYDCSSNATANSTNAINCTSSACSSNATTNSTNTINCTFSSGGGIISDKNDFGDFENAKYSPHQQRLIRALSISGFCLLLLIAIVVAIVCRRRKRASKANATVAAEDSNDDSESTPPALDSESTPPNAQEE